MFQQINMEDDKKMTTQTWPGVRDSSVDDMEAQARKPVEWKPTTHQLLIMILLAIISFMVALDACIIVTSLSSMITALNGDATQAFWVGTAYLLSNSVTMPFTAAVSDIFGRPICLIVSLILFSIGSIICCLAQTIAVLLAGRAIQGIGGGGSIVLCLVIFTDIVPLRFRPKYYGIVLGAWALGSALGPLLGGVFVQFTWRWVFYIMLPFCGFGLVAIPFLLTLKPRTETIGQKLRRVDWFGGALFIASATLALVGISRGGTQIPWNSASSIITLVLGGVGLVGTFVWERYFAREPFLQHSLFLRVSNIATYFCGCVQGLLLFGQLYYVPLYFMLIKGFGAIHTGVALLPVMLTLVPGSIVTGALVTRTNNYRRPIWLGWVLTTVGSRLCLLWDEGTPTAVWAATLVVLGLGHGSVLNAQNFATQAMALPGEEGAAAAMYGFMRQLGTALGVGVGGSAFQNVMQLKLGWLGLPTSLAGESEALAGSALAALPDGAFKSDVMDAIVYGLHGVFAVYTAVAGVAFFVSLFIRHFDMNKEIASEHRLHENRVSRLIAGKGGARLSKADGDVEVRAVSPGDSDTEIDVPRPARVKDIEKEDIWAGVAQAMGHNV